MDIHDCISVDNMDKLFHIKFIGLLNCSYAAKWQNVILLARSRVSVLRSDREAFNSLMTMRTSQYCILV
jgi:hypothetical protein